MQLVFLSSGLTIGNLAFGSEAQRFALFDINGLLVQGELTENNNLLDKIEGHIPELSAKYYRGQLIGFPESNLRVVEYQNAWQGIVFFQDTLYVVINSPTVNDGSQALIQLAPHQERHAGSALCGMPDSMSKSANLDMASTFAEPATAINSDMMPLASSAQMPCDNPIDDVCLLPKIEFAYDVSYQLLSYGGVSPAERAVQEINELEFFFENSFNYRFSQLSLTMLSSTQDALIGAETNPYTLIANLRDARKNGSLDSFLTSRFSIFHLVTGRVFDLVTGQITDPINGGNVVGIAYSGTICNGFGNNVGITDAGDGLINGGINPLVSRVMAHEIGHNLGAPHDGDNNSCAINQNIMSPSIGSFNDFSSCSIAGVLQLVDQQGSSFCFEYPVDYAIGIDTDNITIPPTDVAFDATFNINLVEANFPNVTRVITIGGSVLDGSQGLILAAQALGQNCSVAGDGTSYSCRLVNPVSDFDVIVRYIIDANATDHSVQHSVFSSVDGVVDLNDQNDQVIERFTSFDDDVVVPPVIPAVSVQPSGASESTQRGSSGGGGAVGNSAVFLLLTVFFGIYRRGTFSQSHF